MVRFQRGNVLIIALLLTNLAIVVGFVLVMRADSLVSGIENQERNFKLTKNVEEKARLTMRYEKAVNSDGSGFTNTRSCPASVTLSGTIVPTVESKSTAAYRYGGQLFCSGTSASGTNLLLSYSADGTNFSSGRFMNIMPLVPSGPNLTATFNDPKRTVVTFAPPVGYSGIDLNLDSDDYSPYSTGLVAYPNGYTDNDSEARERYAGYVRQNYGWYNVFWNNKFTASYVSKNTNNTGSALWLIGNTSSGFLYLDIDGPAKLRVVEFDSGTYVASRELKKLSVTEFSFASGSLGYIQNNGSLSGTRSNGDSAKAFDFSQKNYGLFLSYSGNIANTWAIYLKYSLRGENASGSWLYIVPIDDSGADSIRFLSNDIIIWTDGLYMGKQTEILEPK